MTFLNPTGLKWIICDLDSTVCDVTHRVEFAKTRQWDKFHSLCHMDKPNLDIITFVDYISKHCNVVILTGRFEYYREETIKWLSKHNVHADVILMRPNKEHSSSGEMKIRLIEEFFGSRQAVLDNVLLAIDDRDSDTKALRDYGIRVLQVCEGAY